MDEVVGELKTIREEQTLQSHKLSEHEDRIEKIESHLGRLLLLSKQYSFLFEICKTFSRLNLHRRRFGMSPLIFGAKDL